MAQMDKARVFRGFEVIECPRYSHEMKRLERSYRGISRDIDAFLDEMIQVVVEEGLPPLR